MLRRLLTMPWFMREHRFTRTRLSEYVDAELSAAEARRVDRHVELCPQCRRLLVSLRRTVSALGRLGEGPEPRVADGVIARIRSDG